MATSLDQLLQSVRDETTKIDSLSALLSGLRQQLDDVLSGTIDVGTQQKINAIWDAVSSNRKKIQDAIDYVPPMGGNLTGIAIIQPTGNVLIDGVMSGAKWAFDRLPGVITFSFPTSGAFYKELFDAPYGAGENTQGFRAFNDMQKNAMRSVLHGLYAPVCGLRFKEIEETDTESAQLRFAYSSLPYTAWAYFPSNKLAAGDCWFSTKGWYDNPVPGTYAYHCFIHETGHALGLKHGHEIGFMIIGTGPAATVTMNVILPLTHDCLEYSVMSYRSYPNGSTTGGYSNEGGGYPRTLMMCDIAALQTMYGANYKVTPDTYRWSETTGELFINGKGQGAPAWNRILMTVWDGGGIDAIDARNYPGAVVSPEPGGFFTLSAAQIANLGGNQKARGNVFMAMRFNGNPASDVETVLL